MFEMGFMQRAWLAGLIMAVICPVIGSFVVLRRQSLIGEGLGHLAFAGVAGGALCGISPVISAMAACLAGALAIEQLRSVLKENSEMALAIFFYAGMGLAVVLAGMNKDGSFNLGSVLFGSLMTVTVRDLFIVAVLGIAVLVFVIVYYRPLQFLTYDEIGATVSGLAVQKLNVLLSVLTALTVALSMQIVGLLLVSAMMVIPVAAALQTARSFARVLIQGVIYGIISVVIGLTVSFYGNLAPGGIIVLAATLVFLAAMTMKKKPSGHIHHHLTEHCDECSGAGTVAECGHVHHDHEEYQHEQK